MDKTKAIGNLSIVQAISSFLHMAFSFNLRYPKVTADIFTNFAKPLDLFAIIFARLVLPQPGGPQMIKLGSLEILARQD